MDDRRLTCSLLASVSISVSLVIKPIGIVHGRPFMLLGPFRSTELYAKLVPFFAIGRIRGCPPPSICGRPVGSNKHVRYKCLGHNVSSQLVSAGLPFVRYSDDCDPAAV